MKTRACCPAESAVCQHIAPVGMSPSGWAVVTYIDVLDRKQEQSRTGHEVYLVRPTHGGVGKHVRKIRMADVAVFDIEGSLTWC